MNFSGEMTSVEDIPTFSVISRNSVKELSDKRGPEESTKWASVFQAFHTTAGLSLGNRGAWDQLAIALHQAKVDAKEHGRSIELGNGLETIPKFGQEPGSLSSSELSEIEQYLAQACASPLHPLHWLVSNLVEAYNVSYGGVRSHPTLLPHAMEELESITTRLYKVIKVLFPGLPSASAPTRLQIGLSEEVFFKCLYNLKSLRNRCELPHLPPFFTLSSFHLSIPRSSPCLLRLYSMLTISLHVFSFMLVEV